MWYHISLSPYYLFFSILLSSPFSFTFLSHLMPTFLPPSVPFPPISFTKLPPRCACSTHLRTPGPTSPAAPARGRAAAPPGGCGAARAALLPGPPAFPPQPPLLCEPRAHPSHVLLGGHQRGAAHCCQGEERWLQWGRGQVVVAWAGHPWGHWAGLAAWHLVAGPRARGRGGPGRARVRGMSQGGGWGESRQGTGQGWARALAW